MGSQKIT